MQFRQIAARISQKIFKRPNLAVRLLTPFVAILIAIASQGGLAYLLPKRLDFPYVFLYLIAIFISAWFGGYGAAAISSVITMIGLPWMASHQLRFANVDVTRLMILIGVASLISWLAQTQRKNRELLSQSNQALDERVQIQTEQLNRTNLALRRSEERVDLALEAAGIGRWDVDLLTGQINRSPRHDEIFGYELKEGALGGLFDNVLPDHRLAVEKTFQNALQKGGVCEFECPVRHSDGTIHWVWGRGRVFLDESGRPESFLGSSRDITDRKSAEQKLQTQLERDEFARPDYTRDW